MPRYFTLKPFIFLLLGLWGLAGLISQASATPPDAPTPHANGLQQCTGLPDIERLACYDRLAEQSSLEATTATAMSTAIEPTPSNPWDAAIADVPNTVAIPSSPSLTQEQASASADTASTSVISSNASVLERMWDLREDTQRPMFSLSAYHTTYVLPLQYADRVNRQPASPSPGHRASPQDYRQTEAKFQISIRTKIASGLFRPSDSVWFGYTQISQWQVWSSDISRPFRATSYKPEVLYVIPIQYRLPGTGWTWRMAGIGLIHESNGQSNPLSRSWNRAYLSLGLDRNNMAIYSRFWTRFPENSGNDDNPDITHYMGRADITLDWKLRPDSNLSFTLTSNLRQSNKGSIQVNYFFPLSSLWSLSNNLRGYVQIFHGYGETITDYNFRRTAIGIGVALKEW